VAEACAEAAGAWVANDNTPGQVVVAGTINGVKEAGAAALRLGAKRVVPLQVGGAFHTPLMQPAQEPLDAVLAGVAFAPSSPPVIANVDASAHTDGFARLLSAQLCSRVRWRESLLAMAGMGATLFLELGPGTELSGMVKRTVPEAARANVASPEDLEGLRRLLQR
jgi:[acyl-carrier-protein] S-malonyltransferase